MDKAEKKTLCDGCRDSYYNIPGNSTTGECWMLAKAVPVERRLVDTWQPPPYEWAPQTTLSCHHPEGSSWIKSDDCRLTTDPYWVAKAAEKAAQPTGEYAPEEMAERLDTVLGEGSPF